MQDILRIPEASRILGIHPAHLYRLIRSGQVTPKRKHPLSISKSSLRSYLRTRYQFLNELFPELQ
jgi:predicted DNA-binding transcriptional regulator AlpA